MKIALWLEHDASDRVPLPPSLTTTSTPNRPLVLCTPQARPCMKTVRTHTCFRVTHRPNTDCSRSNSRVRHRMAQPGHRPRSPQQGYLVRGHRRRRDLRYPPRSLRSPTGTSTSDVIRDLECGTSARACRITPEIDILSVDLCVKMYRICLRIVVLLGGGGGGGDFDIWRNPCLR